MKKLLTSAIALSIVAGTPALAQQDNRRDRQEARKEARQEARKEARQEARQERREARPDRGENRGIRSGNNPGQHRGWANNPDNRAAQMARGDRNDAARNRALRERRQDAIQDRRQDARRDRVQDARRDRVQDARRDRVQDARRDRLQDRRQDARQERLQDRRQAARQERRWDRVQDRRYYESRWSRRARNFDARVYRRAFVSPRRYRIGPYYRPSGWYYRRWGPGAYFPRLFWSSNYFLDNWFAYGLMSPPWGYEWVRYGPDAVLVDVRTGAILQVRYNVFW